VSGAPPRPPRDPWRGTVLTMTALNQLSITEARVYAMIAMHAASRTRASLTLLGGVLDARRVPVGVNEARRICKDLHDRGLILAANWSTATADTPLAWYLSGQAAPPRLPRYLRTGEDRVKVGGRFTAPRTLDPDLLDTLAATGRLLATHQQVPAGKRDAQWIENLAIYTEQRAAAFHRWATVDATPVVQTEANRLTTAAANIRLQARNRAAQEVKKGEV
jgi:hypothetical protein